MISCPKYYEVQEELKTSLIETTQKYENTHWAKCLRCSGDCDDKAGLEIKLWRSNEVEVSG